MFEMRPFDEPDSTEIPHACVFCSVRFSILKPFTETSKMPIVRQPFLSPVRAP